MLIRHLRYFVRLAEERHFGRAAEACRVAQPTLSQAIRKLEEDLGMTLILRGHSFIGLTPEGEKALRWGRQILADYDSLHEDLAGRKQGGLTGVLRLGVVPAAMPSVALLSERFGRRHPLAEIEARSMSSRTIQRALENFEIDGGLTYLDNEPLERVRRIRLYEERYVFACPASHPLARAQAVTWLQAAAEPLCLLSEDMQNRRILDAAARSAKAELRPKIVSNSFLGVASHLRSGIWCAIVPHTFGLIFGGMPDLALRDMIAPIHRQAIGLVLADRSPQAPMALALEDCAAEAGIEAAFEAAFARRPAPAPA